MRRFPLWLLVFLLLPVMATPQGTKRAIPPGIKEAEKVSNRPLDPPVETRSKEFNVVRVKQEAEELRTLANGLPDQIQQVTNNQLPKDLSDNLKRIEKLAKHLRNEIAP